MFCERISDPNATPPKLEFINFSFVLHLLMILLLLSNANLSFVSGQHECVENQRNLLLEFKNNLTYDPLDSSKLVKWNESIDCCQWGGVKCDSRGRVTALDLSSEYISGGIDDNSTSTLFKLEFLQSLNLAWNDFGWVQLPAGLGRLAGLTYLNLSHSRFYGQIPLEFSNLTRLVVLDLSNDIYSPLKLENPDLKTLIHNFSRLRELYLDFANISANGNQWCNAISSSLPDLRVLSLPYTGITGPFDPSLAKLRFLSVIRLGGNTFSSPFPGFFADFSRLRVLTMSSCNLSGVTPGKLFQITTLRTIDLSRNMFLEVSLREFPLNCSLQNLKLRNTSLSRNLHDSSIGNLKMLQVLDLRGNNLEGPIPQFLFELRNLSTLILSGNKFNGFVDLTDFQKLPNLVELYLSYNNLSVHINENVSMSSLLPRLRYLGLASCKLQKFPLLKNHSSLAELDLSDNKLKGEIPNWIWDVELFVLNLSNNQFINMQEPYDLSQVQLLDLHSNMLGGHFPVHSSIFYYMDLSNNNFSSSLPENIGNSLQYSSFFSIANNNISGSIPPSLCNASGLEVLDLSNNSFNGKIPSCLVTETPSVLNLRRNNLSGNIPDMFPLSCSLETLDLSWNGLQGQVPKSLSRCSKIEILNLGNNNLNDVFPCSLKNLSELRVLELHSNTFHGNINCLQADSFTWPNLQIINLASNNFNGVLPGNLFRKLQGMMVKENHTKSHLDYLHFVSYDVLWARPTFYLYSVTVTAKGHNLDLKKILPIFTSIDFSNNHFEGVIPETVGELKSLYALDFSRNALSGHIPSSLGKLQTLGSLDLSANHLDGEIPQELVSLTFLSFLNVSQNELFGRIPPGRQLQTFPESSFQGNRGLCGFPLNKTCGGDVDAPEVPERSSGEEHESSGRGEIYVSAAWEFLVGLGVIIVPLLFSKRCSYWFDMCFNKFVVAVVNR